MSKPLLIGEIWVGTPSLEKAGVDKCVIHRNTKEATVWKWQWGRGANGRRHKVVLLASMQDRYRERYLDWLALHNSEEYQRITNLPQIEPVVEQPPPKDNLSELHRALLRLPAEERETRLAEIQRLAQIVERYDALKSKRQLNKQTGKYEFTSEVFALCEECKSDNETIIKRESRRAQCPSPYTLDGWLRDYRKDGLLTFLRSIPSTTTTEDLLQPDRRKAVISEAAVEWVNKNWRNHTSARHLYKAAKAKARKEGWVLPSEAWFYRRWKALPRIVTTTILEGKKAYTSKYAPYVPRDFSDIDCLQIVCGDHSERDVTVLLRDGRTLARPWLTVWQDMRTGLIWGWHLDLVPSSYTAGMAYADGVMNFGAQPLSRPDDGFYSFVYTDQGRDYKSHNWDGNVIEVHKLAMRFDGGIEVLRVQRRVGFLDELGIKHILARGYNAKEKPVERLFRDISDWEMNTFDEFCGRDAKYRPDSWRELYAQHQQFLKGKRSASPAIGFDEYREALAGWITEFNSIEHERSTLAGARIIPVEEYRRLYTTRFEIAEEALALLLMKAEKRVIRKNGVQCFQKHWYFYHPAMAEFKGQDVEIRFSDSDYTRVWCFLPNGQICEAQLVTPTSVLKPNKQTLGLIAQAAAHERKVIRDFNFLTSSTLRGETTEDRVAAQLDDYELEDTEAIAAEAGGGARVQKMTRMDRPKLRAVPRSRSITAEQVNGVPVDESIFDVGGQGNGKVLEFDFEEEIDD